MARTKLDDVLNDDDLDLLDVKAPIARSSAGGRGASGFEEINAFIDQNNREPVASRGADSREKIMARHLEAIRKDASKCEALLHLDRHRLLAKPGAMNSDKPSLKAVLGNQEGVCSVGKTSLDDILADEDLDVAPADFDAEQPVSTHVQTKPVPVPALPKPEPTSLAEILDDDELDSGGDIFRLEHVRRKGKVDQPDYVARRRPCASFEQFKPAFDQATRDLDTGKRKSIKFAREQEMKVGDLFILRGVMAYVAQIQDPFNDRSGHPNARLRLIYSNGTESDALLRSFTGQLYNDPNGRRITDPAAGPLFGGEPGDEDVGTGTIYVLRSLSKNPEIVKDRNFLLKIGVTSGDVQRRIQDAEHDPTFLMAPVEIVATYALFNVSRVKLENLLHRFFDPARADIEIRDRFGQPVKPREWFFVTPDIVREAVQRLEDGSLTRMRYDRATARIVEGT